MSRTTNLRNGAAELREAVGRAEACGHDGSTDLRPVVPDARWIVDTSSRAAVATDSANRITHWNGVATELLGHVAGDAIGRNLQEVIQAHDVFGNPLCSDHCAFHAMARAGAAPENFDLDVITAVGQRVRVAVSVVVVLVPADGHSLVYLMTPKRRRRRADEAIDRLLSERYPTGEGLTGADQRGRRRTPALTRRQKEVLALMVLGRNSVEMAEELGVSVHTVRSHVQAVLRAFKASSRVEAVSRALNERVL